MSVKLSVMKFSFVLDRPQSEAPTYIFFLASLNDGRLKYSLKEQILPTHWDKTFQRPTRVKDTKQAERYKALHKKLDRVANRFEELSNDAKSSGKPLLKQNVIYELDLQLNKVTKVDYDNFITAANLIIEDMTNGTLLTARGKRYTAGTLKNYGQSMDKLTNFQASQRRHSLNFSELTLDTYKAFVSYLNSFNYSLNYIGQHIKNWKCLIDEAHTRGWHTNTIYKHRDFQTLSEETYDIYLSDEELNKIAEKKISNKTRDICRDWFIIDCFTGLRISDLKLLNDRNLDGDRLVISNVKTGAKVVLPIHPKVRAIIKKYKGNFPPPVADQTINEEIKKVGEVCHINKTILYSVTEGGRKMDYYFKKFEMMSNHTARRSFITNLLRQGYQESLIMKLTGIVTAKTLQRYNKMSEEEVADQAAELDYFKNVG